MARWCPGEPGRRRARNAVYDLIRPATVDGILSLSGLLGAYVGADDLERFHVSFHPLPIVSLCGKLGDHRFTTKPDGHGFGLHTCASYMKQMGGSIRASSEGPGRGATFTLVLEGAGNTS